MPDNLPATVRNFITMAQATPRLAEDHWNQLPPATQLALIGSVSADDQATLLLLSEDATPLVQAMVTPQLTQVLTATDDLSAGALVGCCSPTQHNQLLDLRDIGQSGTDGLRRWLTWAIELSESAFDQLAEGLDLALLADAIAPNVIRIDADEDLVHLYRHQGISYPFTPAQVITRYHYAPDDLLEEFLGLLHSSAEECFSDLCLMLLGDWETERAQLVDEGHRQQRAELGLPTNAEAAAIDEPWAGPGRATASKAAEGNQAESSDLIESRSLLTNLLLTMSDSEAEQFRHQLRHLAMCIVIRDGYSPDGEGLARALERCHHQIEAGLRWLGAPNAPAALQIGALGVLQCGRSSMRQARSRSAGNHHETDRSSIIAGGAKSLAARPSRRRRHE